MTIVKFYEKTGCINNTKQKKILELAGHSVEAINIIKYKWTEPELRGFFKGLELKSWFNKNAPTIASGEDKVENYNEVTALKAMVKNPLLIRRPLIEVFDIKVVGFNKEELHELIGLNNKNKEMQSLLSQNLEVCQQKGLNTSCD